MLTYQLRERIFQFQSATQQEYPAQVTVSIELEPKVQFGGEPGFTRNAVSDRELKVNFNLSTGRSQIRCDEPLFEPVQTSLNIAETKFSIKQNVATVSSRCTSQQDLNDLVSALFYVFPAILNVKLPDVPFPTLARGIVGGNRFNWIFEPRQILQQATVTSKSNQEKLITNSWRQLPLAANSRRLMGGLHYFHVACRMLAAGATRFEFAAESLLNFAKSLQSTFGETREDVREELAKLDTPDIEAKLIPALILRNEFDVGHVSLALLSSEQLRTLHEYTALAENAFRALYAELLKKLEAGDYSMRQDPKFVLSSKKAAILQRLANEIKPFV